MPGFSIPSQAIDQLAANALEYMRLAESARVTANRLVLEDLQSRARANPAWAPMADHIDTWDEHDRTWWGIRGPEFESESMLAEYGTDVTPPSGVLRTLDDSMQRAAMRASGMMTNNRSGY